METPTCKDLLPGVEVDHTGRSILPDPFTFSFSKVTVLTDEKILPGIKFVERDREGIRMCWLVWYTSIHP